MDRDRDRRFSERDRFAARDDTYRPGPSRDNRDRRDSRDSYRSRVVPPAADSYIPATSARARPRSRTPPIRADSYRRRSRSPSRDDRYKESYRTRSRERPRSPPRRSYSLRRDDDRYRARSPGRSDSRYFPLPRRERERSPPPKRNSRDASLDRRDARSPPPKRERLASPPRGRHASRSPPRRAISPPRASQEDNYRPLSRSPKRRNDRDPPPSDRHARRSPSPLRPSNPQSGATSRRSSPPVHPSRLRQVPDERSPRGLEISHIATPPRDSSYHQPRNGIPPSGPANRGTRAPPTGPAASSRNFSSPAMSPPIGPSSVAASPISAHSRAIQNNIHGVSGHARGSFAGSGGYPSRGGFRGGGYGAARGGYQGESSVQNIRRASEAHHSPGTRAFSNSSVLNAPSGPRGGGSGGPPTGPSGVPTGPGGAYRGGPPPSGPGGGSHGNGSSQTYPRTQRFLSDLPAVVPGGRKMPAPALDPNKEAKMKRLEDEAQRLRKLIEEKEKGTRVQVREWDRLESEGELSKLRTELAEESLRKVEVSGL